MTKRYMEVTDSLTGKSAKLPIFEGTLGQAVVDIRDIQADLDLFTFDPGFMATASCKSRLTFIDGNKGQLLHGGYSIDELADNSNFLEVCYLLLHGELPTKPKKRNLTTPSRIILWCMNRFIRFSVAFAVMPTRWRFFVELPVRFRLFITIPPILATRRNA